MKKIIAYFGFGLIALLMIIAALSLLAPRFGLRADAVFSGSMEPRLKVGGLAISRPVKTEDIKVGNIIICYSPLNKKLTSHRVIAVVKDSSFGFRTKGDANEDADPFIVPAQNVEAKVCFCIPYLGYFTNFIKTPLGFVLAFCLPGLILIIMELRDIWRVLWQEELNRRHRIKIGR